MVAIIDEQVLEELKEVMEDEFSVLLETFISDAPLRLDELRAALAQNDIEALEKPAHTLKGSSSNIGATALSAICARLVDEIRAGSVSDAASVVAQIEASYTQTEAALKQYL